MDGIFALCSILALTTILATFFASRSPKVQKYMQELDRTLIEFGRKSVSRGTYN